MQVDLAVLADPKAVAVALALTAAAIVGKLAAGFAAGKGRNPGSLAGAWCRVAKSG